MGCNQTKLVDTQNHVANIDTGGTKNKSNVNRHQVNDDSQEDSSSKTIDVVVYPSENKHNNAVGDTNENIKQNDVKINLNTNSNKVDCLKQRQRASKPITTEQNVQSDIMKNLTNVRKPPQELTRILLNNKYFIPWSNITLNSVIALGSISKVFSGKYVQIQRPSSPDKRALKKNIKTTKEIAMKRFFRVHAGMDRNLEKEIFFSEIRILQKLSHPSIIQYFGTTFSHPFYWIVTEYCENGNLETRLLQNKDIIVSSAEVYTILFDVMQGIEYLHNLDPIVVHRDIKPSNILIRKDGHAVLGDFGYAIELNTETRLSSRLGSPAYVAPEIFLGRSYDESIDIYAFGIVMWEMLNRKIPYGDMIINDSAESMQNLMQYICLGGRLILESNSSISDANNFDNTSFITNKSNKNNRSRRSNSPFMNAGKSTSSSSSNNNSNFVFNRKKLESYNILMEACWQQVPSERPSPKDVLIELKRIFSHVDVKSFNKYQEIIRKLPSDIPSPQLQLLRSMKEDDTFEAGLLLISGATLNNKTPDGWNILHESVAMGNRNAIKFILGWNGEEKINLEEKTENENLNALDLAKFCGRSKITLDILHAQLNYKSTSSFSEEEENCEYVEDSANDYMHTTTPDLSDNNIVHKLEYLCTACETYIIFTRMHKALTRWKLNTSMQP
jgi:serine/threonine protein kinase